VEYSCRVVSQFFHFNVSRDKAEPTDAEFEYYIFDNGMMVKDHCIRTLRKTTNNTVVAANGIMADYDFIEL
jgi:hypothetical protein